MLFIRRCIGWMAILLQIRQFSFVLAFPSWTTASSRSSRRVWEENPVIGCIQALRPIQCLLNRPSTAFLKRSSALLQSSVLQNDPNVPKTATEPWNGEVVANSNDGRIRGCTIRPVSGNNSDNENDAINTEWIITIDGIEADLGRFSEAIYKKFIQDAKQQRFQGFRPGTIPPHLEPTYRTFAMDECARETVLEAMQQNSIRPFENCRAEIYLYDFCIPPAAATKSSSKNKKAKKSSRKVDPSTTAVETDAPDSTPTLSVEPSWRTFATMKEAIDGGWRPGQSFSFSAKNVRGQKVQTSLGTPS